MKKSFALIILALVVSLASAQTSQKQTKRTFSMEDLEGLSLVNVDDEPLQGPIAGLDVVSITFDVDKGLSAPKETIPAYDDQEIAKKIVNVIQIPQELHRVVKTSFEGERLCYLGEDNFFKCMVQAYADHRPLVLSPDMIWLIISQGFARYVNAHAEEMRDLLVSHEGKMDLIVNSNNNVLTPDADWERLLNDFSLCVAANTKGELADLMTADFSTTGITERIASQISLMDVVKEYFYFSNIAGICGIPSITLKGRTEDWQKVLDKVRCLKKYNLEKWSDDLEVILEEFVEASKGKYRRWFWQNIVKKLPVDQLTTQRSCLPNAAKTTRLDGWFLKFFPNEEGETRDSVLWNSSMPQEMTRVGFKQILTDTNTDEVVMAVPMELWAGFVGIEEDAKTRALTPKIGWLARIADEESDEVGRMKEQNKYMALYFYLNKDQEVPHALSKMDHIRSLHLDFGRNPVVIPEWLDNILIDKLSITGQLTDDEEAQLRQRFPKAEIKRVEGFSKEFKQLPAEESEPPTSVQDDGYDIDSVLIVVNGKMLPKSMNRQLLKPRTRIGEVVNWTSISIEEALKDSPIGPGNVDNDRHFYFDYRLKKDLRAYFLRRDEYVKEVRALVDAAATAIYGEAGANGAIEITTRPFLSVAPLSPDESKALRQSYLSDVYANYGNGHTISTASAFRHDGFIYNGEDHAFAPDLYDTPVEEQFFGQMTYLHGHSTNEFLGALGSDSRGVYVPLVRQVEIKLPANVNQAHVDSVVNAIRQAARQADKSIERTDSLVRLAFIFGGEVKEGKPHLFRTFPMKEDGSSDMESRYYFTPDAKAESSWWAEAYFRPTHPSLLVMHLVSVDKLYASDCPAILENRRHMEGTVLDYESGKPVADALVYIETTMGISDAGGVRTDKKGRLDLWLPFENERVRVSRSGYKDSYWILPADTAITIRLIPSTSSKQQPSIIKKVITIGNGVKAGDTISGTVSDEMGPLMGAVVCEIDVNGRILESAITDNNGQFTMKIKNPQDSLRFSYVGTKTVFQAIDKKEYKIKLQQVSNLQDMRMRMRQSGPSTLPIPIKEISMKELKELGIEIDEEGVSNEHNPRIQINLSDEEQTLVMSVNDLGFNMFRKVGAKESILLSPLGMTYALGLINNGATGMTRTQINKVLGCDNVDAVNIFCRKMLTESPKLDKLAKIDITNDFFSPKSFPPKPTFTNVAKDLYDTKFGKSESDQLNFSLVNTIDFKGIWTNKFLKANTKDEVFKSEDGKETMVPMMNQTRQFFYTENDLCQALCMPYSNGAYQMIVLLPKDGKTIQEVAQSLTADSWEKMYDQMREVNVDVKLPRFESESEVNLTGMMSALMPNAFSMKKADFSNLFDIESCIRMIMQKGHIKVDETGAEATVATILQGRITGLDLALPQTTLFHATHPFLYFIREWSTGTIFFIGQYMGT
ncbi:MAG: DUF4419 domain-containing protein [Prevotella sp.]|nr:DUF4419 domain-containing protein [Prevotella sp.]